ncbi:hypothetical protein [Pseudobacteriovorax antillogorgiicola]|uniref:Uncharacterized protein n=1 Tax=Pseudobacteriovorax antillogorgiicola TaxID=1513793 RepID=A0A1Y6CJS9_9BACT|nr:hypothetical protein [Pseudobacteriovorax antillogorgiicola]TCS48360.1 hypothetical protein EDD56_118140 [Pseudobacteriovorax antillogorgiicola]SMF56189.1 hypothetical protein SAMN06296036_1181 [Pseudobacteriovorax antillogorgiicola]
MSQTIQISAYSSLVEPVEIDFPHKLTGKMEHGSAELQNHLEGFMGYVQQQADGTMTRQAFSVLDHLHKVKHCLAFEISESNLDHLAGWAQRSNSILFLRDGSIRSPNGQVILAPGVELESLEGRVPLTEESNERRERSYVKLEDLKLKAPPIPFSISESEVILRDWNSPKNADKCLLNSAVYFKLHGAKIA